MAVQLTIEYNQLIELVEQLSEDQQKDLIARLLKPRPSSFLTIEEKIQLLDAVKITHPINENPSVRRQDWYGDDGR